MSTTLSTAQLRAEEIFPILKAEIESDPLTPDDDTDEALKKFSTSRRHGWLEGGYRMEMLVNPKLREAGLPELHASQLRGALKVLVADGRLVAKPYEASFQYSTPDRVDHFTTELGRVRQELAARDQEVKNMQRRLRNRGIDAGLDGHQGWPGLVTLDRMALRDLMWELEEGR